LTERRKPGKFRWKLADFRHRVRGAFYVWLADRFPRELVSACGWRQWAHAVDGRWGCTLEESCALTCEEVQVRWFQKS
jgi:hypothetical protein